MKTNDIKTKLTDPQYLDLNYERYYFIPFPDCQYFDELDDDDNVIPVCTQVMTGSFVSMEFIDNLQES